MTRIIGKQWLDQICNMLPIIAQLYPTKVIIAVTDTGKYIAHHNISSDRVSVGTPIKEGSSVHRAIKEKRRIVQNLPKELFGMPMKTLAEPVWDENDNVIGAIAMSFSRDNEFKLAAIIEQFSEAFEQVNKSIQQISTGAQRLAEVGENLSNNTQEANEKVNKTDEIIQMVKNIADQIKLLGLNAAIEAARVGEHGRGFAVVASEIRRLSEESNASTKEATTVLKEISSSINSIHKKTLDTSRVSEDQSSAIQEIAAAVEELSAQLESLNNLAQDL